MVLCPQVHFIAEGHHKRVIELHEIEEDKSEAASSFLKFLGMHAFCLWGDTNSELSILDLYNGGKGKK